MNILVPDSWLREYLVTDATPKQIKEYLSLCGPSVERIHHKGKEVVYDIEVTTNRPDSMSILGIAREAAAILPRFGITARLVHDLYAQGKKETPAKKKLTSSKPISITTDASLNPRWTSVVFDHVSVGASPEWLQKKLELTGIRPINNVVDITNFLMRAYGQPAHAFDYDQIQPKHGVPTMVLRASKKGEKLTTLDGKRHALPGGDIVIEDGSGSLIDLCGIMGGQSSSIKETTKTVVLFLQTYNPVNIRKTSMALAHRTEAASLFEKGLDPELVFPVFLEGMKLMEELTGGAPASPITDIYPSPYKPRVVSAPTHKIDAYLGISLPPRDIAKILVSLGFHVAKEGNDIRVTVPSFRRDVAIDVDIIEEIARLYGYHNIKPKLPSGEPPDTQPDTVLSWEEALRVRLQDWGYTETYTYSMISEELMQIFELDTARAYKIANPLSSEWVYMRPSLLPSMLASVKQNLAYQDTFKTFELSMTYQYRPGQLPEEKPSLVVAWVGENYRQVKGLAEALFDLLGVSLPQDVSSQGSLYFHPSRSLVLGTYGVVGEANPPLLKKLGVSGHVTILELDIHALLAEAQPEKKYTATPKYPPVYEDLAFVTPLHTYSGPLMRALKNAHPYVHDVTLLDTYETTQTLHVTYLNPKKNLTAEEIQPVREKLIRIAQENFSAILKGV